MLENDYAGRRCLAYRGGFLDCSSRWPLGLFAAAFIACLAACGGSTNVLPGPPPATQHLYVDGAGHAVQFALPLAASTPTPTATLSLSTASDVSALAVDSTGNVAAGASGGSISIFSAPITGSASPSATFKNGTSTSVDNLAFNSAGDLFATTNSNSINVFTHPLTSASTPSQVITSANLTTSVGIVLDSANNLIVSNLLPGPTASNLLVYAPPYTGLPIATAAVPAANYRQMVISGTQLFVVAAQVSQSRIDVYNLPITAASSFAFFIRTGLFGGSVTGDGVAFDSSGNLYAGLSGNTGPPDMGAIRIYVPPFSAASAPTVANGVFGTTMAIGK